MTFGSKFNKEVKLPKITQIIDPMKEDSFSSLFYLESQRSESLIYNH